MDLRDKNIKRIHRKSVTVYKRDTDLHVKALGSSSFSYGCGNMKRKKKRQL